MFMCSSVQVFECSSVRVFECSSVRVEKTSFGDHETAKTSFGDRWGSIPKTSVVRKIPKTSVLSSFTSNHG